MSLSGESDLPLVIPMPTWAIRAVLVALVGPPHYIREMQAWMNLGDLVEPNPINELLDAYATAVRIHSGTEETAPSRINN